MRAGLNERTVSGVPRIERPTGWLGKRGFVQTLEHQIVGRRLRLGADLLHDDVLLAAQFFRIEGRLGQDVGQHVERERHVGLEHAGIIGGRFRRWSRH